MSTALDEQSLSLKVPLKEGNIAETKKITFRTHVKINPRKHCATFAPSTFFEIKKTPGTGPLPAPAQPPPSVPDRPPPHCLCFLSTLPCVELAQKPCPAFCTKGLCRSVCSHRGL